MLTWKHMSSLLSCTPQCPIRHKLRRRHRHSASAECAQMKYSNKSTILLLIVLTTAQTQRLHWQHMSSLLSCTSQCPNRHDRRRRHRHSASAEEARVKCSNKSTILLLIVVCVDKRECRSSMASATIPRRKHRFSSDHRS
ncbi:unnamed protein product [Schistocephalus solidus]|uniref:Secreted protein n=1 Tax=Schistocephalus solidus TaxID=70667 RepID=A0A183SCM4_SCHSO|nr:unnamed protein product [Schistocephalus solidus]